MILNIIVFSFVICLMIVVCKTSENQRSQTNFHAIKYIKSNIYLFINILYIYKYIISGKN